MATPMDADTVPNRNVRRTPLVQHPLRRTLGGPDHLAKPFRRQATLTLVCRHQVEGGKPLGHRQPRVFSNSMPAVDEV